MEQELRGRWEVKGKRELEKEIFNLVWWEIMACWCLSAILICEVMIQDQSLPFVWILHYKNLNPGKALHIIVRKILFFQWKSLLKQKFTGQNYAICYLYGYNRLT